MFSPMARMTRGSTGSIHCMYGDILNIPVAPRVDNASSQVQPGPTVEPHGTHHIGTLQIFSGFLFLENSSYKWLGVERFFATNCIRVRVYAVLVSFWLRTVFKTEVFWIWL